jgi:hypothetical protein
MNPVVSRFAATTGYRTGRLQRPSRGFAAIAQKVFTA